MVLLNPDIQILSKLAFNDHKHVSLLSFDRMTLEIVFVLA